MVGFLSGADLIRLSSREAVQVDGARRQLIGVAVDVMNDGIRMSELPIRFVASSSLPIDGVWIGAKLTSQALL